MSAPLPPEVGLRRVARLWAASVAWKVAAIAIALVLLERCLGGG
jgi:hypothetical protein